MATSSGNVARNEVGQSERASVPIAPQPPPPVGNEHTRNKHDLRDPHSTKEDEPAGADASITAQLEAGISPDEPIVLVHGTLDVIVFEARELPNMDSCAVPFDRCYRGCTAPIRKRGHHVKGPTSDPYVTVALGAACIARTREVENDAFPEWNQHFVVPVAHTAAAIVFEVKDNDSVGSQFIGRAGIPMSRVLGGEPVEAWLDLFKKKGQPAADGAQLRVRVRFTPVGAAGDRYGRGLGPAAAAAAAGESAASAGVGAGAGAGVAAGGKSAGAGPFEGVESAYFPARAGCRLTLYQDAHVADDFRPNIELEGGRVYQPARCWEDICRAIVEAKHAIYITGWSVWHKVVLMRDPARPMLPGGNLSLGELLKKRAAEGVRVLVLQWDDKTSFNSPLVNSGGVMATHDEDTQKYFRNSKVRCLLAARLPDSKLSLFRQQLVGTFYTHHQKTVVADAPLVPAGSAAADGGAATGGGGTRHLVAFVGGIDLCDGRYDTQAHSLFRTIRTVHADDFKQNNVANITKETGGPRQPWHDLHCRVEGPAAWDVLANFQQRWRRIARFRKERRHRKDLEVFYRVPQLARPAADNSDRWKGGPGAGDPAVMVTHADDPATWHSQLFRSIDSGSVKGFPDKAKIAEAQHLAMEKGVVVDRSMHEGWVQAIRRAHHFVYIESQYFLGSSFAWDKHTACGCNNMIPIELALKVASKIRAGEPFGAYVVLPMWPEGIPESGTVQAILNFQTETMRMMYKIIGQAIEEKGLQGVSPRDFLGFYCLANREVKDPDEPEPAKPYKPDSNEAKSFKNRRQMIYVHSKMVVADDEYVIVGSANINQRSLDGLRDTEIALGSFQPAHAWHKKGDLPRGEIHGFRMSLWAEHTGQVHPLWSRPWTVECMRAVNADADARWQQYAADEVTELHGHLVSYPVDIGAHGSVGLLPGHEKFPDTNAPVVGKAQQNLPDTLTT